MEEIFNKITESPPFLPTKSVELPSYKCPPIAEVAIGVQFKPLKDLLTSHYGLWWKELKDAFPVSEEKPLLAPVIEAFPQQPQQMNFTFSEVPSPPRVWFKNAEDTSLVQLQRDRFVCNWKENGGAAYPSFDFVFDRYQENLSSLRKFLEENSIGEIVPVQYELAYVNSIDLGNAEEEYGIEKLLPWIGSVVPPFENKKPNSVDLHYAYDLPFDMGRLRVIAKAERSEIDSPIRLQFIVRGMPPSPEDDHQRAWFRMAHVIIVKAFEVATSEWAQKTLWGKTDDYRAV
jgi:uncharacterized protein (TIGR04255 family)